MLYQYAERFVSVFSHDEVVHGKASLLYKMGAWHIPEKAANLRALYAHMWAYPGKKLLFMGGEFAQAQEWSHDASLDWHLCQYMDHEGVRRLVGDLNRLYVAEPVSGLKRLQPPRIPLDQLLDARRQRDCVPAVGLDRADALSSRSATSGAPPAPTAWASRGGGGGRK